MIMNNGSSNSFYDEAQKNYRPTKTLARVRKETIIMRSSNHLQYAIAQSFKIFLRSDNIGKNAILHRLNMMIELKWLKKNIKVITHNYKYHYNVQNCVKSIHCQLQYE